MPRITGLDGAITFGVTGAILALNLVTGVILARQLGVEGRGEFGAVTVAPTMASWLFALGASQAVAYHLSRRPQDSGGLLSAWLIVLTVSGLAGLVVLQIVLPTLLMAQPPATVLLARLWATTILVTLFGEAFTGSLLADHDFRFYNGIRLAQQLVIAGAYVALAVAHSLTVQAALIAVTLGYATYAGAAAVRSLSRHRLSRPDARLARESVWFGVRAHGSNLAFVTTARLDLLILPAMATATAVGLYSVASNASWVIVTLAASLAPFVLPAAARAGSRSPIVVGQALRWCLLIAVLAGAALGAVAESLVVWMFGPSFQGTASLLRILIPGCVAYAGAQVLWSGLSAMGQPGRAALSQVPGVLVTIVGLLWALPRYGVSGAAVVSATAYAVSFLAALYAYLRSNTREDRLIFMRAGISLGLRQAQI